MRIPDRVLKCVGFVAQPIPALGRTEYNTIGSGFFVAVPSGVRGAGSYLYFVVAKHTIDGCGRLVVLADSLDGTRRVLNQLQDDWVTHPTADVALLPVQNVPNLGVVPVPIGMFLERSRIAGLGIGIGDEVFMVGLFDHLRGETRNSPIVRIGNLAMMPEDQIQVVIKGKSTFVDGYLIEAHSIGGISGSPVFIRFQATWKLRNKGKVDVGQMIGLIGLTHGHYDIPVSDVNAAKPRTLNDRTFTGVNMGIAVVTPAIKILETLNRPNLTELRKRVDAELLRTTSPKQDW